jgi:hypothetical protein
MTIEGETLLARKPSAMSRPRLKQNTLIIRFDDGQYLRFHDLGNVLVGAIQKDGATRAQHETFTASGMANPFPYILRQNAFEKLSLAIEHQSTSRDENSLAVERAYSARQRKTSLFEHSLRAL